MRIGKPRSKNRRIEERRAQDAQFRSIIENAPFGVVLADTAGQPLEYNPAFVRIFGYSEDELRSMRIHDLAHPENAADTEKMIRGLVDGDFENAQTEVRCVCKDGSVVWVLVAASTVRNPDGELALSIAMIEDITGRKVAEEATVVATTGRKTAEQATVVATTGREVAEEATVVATTGRKTAEQATVAATNWADELIENTGALVMGLDAGGKVDTFNRAAEEIAGYAREELEGRSWFEILVPRDRYPSERREFERLRSSGLPPVFESSIVTKAGVERQIVWYSSERSNPAGTMLVGVDISDRKRAEKERALLNAELLQAQKMEAVGRLAGGVAHNFNNLLTAISGYSELALAQLPESSEVRADVEEIKRATERASSVAQGLLHFSRRDKEQRGNLDLNEIVSDMEILLRHLIPSHVEIANSLAPDLREVVADRNQLEQILTNLALNASDAMPGGGKLTFETANLDLAESDRKRDVSLAPGRYVTLVVRDTGIGMDEQTRSRVFEPFFTTKGPESGTGLGLAAVFGIIDEAGGQVVVDSRPNEGTTFTIYLPATDSPAKSGDTPKLFPAP